MPKFPKLFALNVPLSVVRSSRKEYELKDGFFTPETYEDFYFFIRQGFLLEGDPDIKFNTNQKINFGMNDDDVRSEMAKRKGANKEIIIDADFKDRCYSDFYKDIALKVERGEMAAYPSDINERADAYYKEKLKEAEDKQEKIDNPTSTIVETTPADIEEVVETTEPNSSTDGNGPGPDADIIPTPENTEIFDENATIDDSATTTDEVEESLPTGEAIVDGDLTPEVVEEIEKRAEEAGIDSKEEIQGEAVVNDVEEAQVKKKK